MAKKFVPVKKITFGISKKMLKGLGKAKKALKIESMDEIYRKVMNAGLNAVLAESENSAETETPDSAD